jgi:alkyl sulfatase BDS1-like metallo-beta-lactamase superfamily hydrolase
MELFHDILAIRVDSRKAEGLRFTMNLQTPDNGEQFIVELNNSTLTHIKGFQLQIPDLTLVIYRCDLKWVMAGATTLFELIAAIPRDNDSILAILRDHAGDQSRPLNCSAH